MKVELESTERIVELELHGQVVPARVWVGKTGRGVEVHAYITRIAVHKDLDASEFEKDLQTAHVALPAHLSGAIPGRLVIG